jgi:hypothetical protein
MILTPHILLGAAIGSKIASPGVVFSLSFLSHYLLDALPHYEYDVSGLKGKSAKKIIIDLLQVAIDFSIGMALALFLVWNSPFRTTAILGMLSALVPDMLLFLHYRYPKSKFLNIFAVPHHAVHYLKNLSPAWLSLATEIIVSLAIIFFLVYTI